MLNKKKLIKLFTPIILSFTFCCNMYPMAMSLTKSYYKVETERQISSNFFLQMALRRQRQQHQQQQQALQMQMSLQKLSSLVPMPPFHMQQQQYKPIKTKKEKYKTKRQTSSACAFYNDPDEDKNFWPLKKSYEDYIKEQQSLNKEKSKPTSTIPKKIELNDQKKPTEIISPIQNNQHQKKSPIRQHRKKGTNGNPGTFNRSKSIIVSLGIITCCYIAYRYWKKQPTKSKNG